MGVRASSPEHSGSTRTHDSTQSGVPSDDKFNPRWNLRSLTMPESESTNQEIVVFIANRDSTCGECGESLGRKAWIRLAGDKGALCLSCADLDHLAFLPSGDTALTRRAKKYSGLSAVVLQWSRARKRYERQGLLVEEAAL